MRSCWPGYHARSCWRRGWVAISFASSNEGWEGGGFGMGTIKLAALPAPPTEAVAWVLGEVLADVDAEGEGGERGGGGGAGAGGGALRRPARVAPWGRGAPRSGRPARPFRCVGERTPPTVRRGG